MKVKYIEFGRSKPSPSGKTRIWLVMTRSLTGIRFVLGEIKWKSEWRRYVYFPELRTVYDPDCLRSIADFVEGRTGAHNKLLARRRAAMSGESIIATGLRL